jgi:hypothetical protein
VTHYPKKLHTPVVETDSIEAISPADDMMTPSFYGSPKPKKHWTRDRRLARRQGRDMKYLAGWE